MTLFAEESEQDWKDSIDLKVLRALYTLTLKDIYESNLNSQNVLNMHRGCLSLKNAQCMQCIMHSL